MKKNEVDMSRFACTTMIVGKKASTDGSVIIAHSDDDVSDERVIYVPRRKWNLNNRNERHRPVYYDNASLGPSEEAYNSTDIRRYIGNYRGPGYRTQREGYEESTPLGYIPQVEETYAYFDSSYGIMNEHNLMIGECTCGAKYHAKPESGKRIFYSAELSRVALERCKTAREAIVLISNLIRDYGYYGTGETLLIGDTEEAWVMEMCAYEMEGEDGIWVAQRVKDTHFFVAANEFRIREVHKGRKLRDYCISDSDSNIWYSTNLFEVAKQKRWKISRKNGIDWLSCVSWGEYSHPYYSLRRVWRAFSKVAPSYELPAYVKDGYSEAYPFSLEPDQKLSVLDLANVYRDHYEGTEFDLTKGEAAGPWENPLRYENNPDQGDSFNLNTYHPKGAWERPLSIYRCGMMWINQAKVVNGESIGFSWIGLDRPVANCIMPFYTKMNNLPRKIQTMNVLDFQFNGDSAWWAFNFVANYANLNYKYMMKEVQELQHKMEARAETQVQEYFREGLDGNPSRFCSAHFSRVIRAWWDLASKLIVKYNNGGITTGPNDLFQKIDYPKNWLKKTNYHEGPVKYHKHHHLHVEV